MRCVWQTALEPRTVVECVMSVCVGFLHFSIDSVNSTTITSDCPSWNFRVLSSYQHCVGITCTVFTNVFFHSFWSFHPAFTWANVENCAFLWIHHLNFKNIYITMNNINQMHDTIENVDHISVEGRYASYRVNHNFTIKFSSLNFNGEICIGTALCR